MTRGSLAWMTAALALGCARPGDVPPPAPSVPGPTLAAASAERRDRPEPEPSVSASSASSASAAVPPAPVPPQPAAQLTGLEFLAQARTIFRIAACGPAGDIPTRLDAAVVARHCEELGRAYSEYRRGWLDVAEPFLAALRPTDLPRVVVYPFGGGDLVTALATFPDATELTTISLEPAGDVRPVDTLAPDLLAHELGVHRIHLERLFEKAHSRTDNLEKEARTELPGEILFALAALVVHGDEPVSLRYFRLRPDGSLVYVTQGDIDAAKKPGDKRALFANAELRFRKSGDAGAPVQVLRHVSANLDDAHLQAAPGLLAYLNARGRVAAMTKAATHLLWNDHFSAIRGWLLDHTDWMVSDSTGLPPRAAGPAGFTQDTYGVFDGPSPFGDPDHADADDLRKLFASQPARDLAFRYGYPDVHGHAHLIVTHRAPR